MKLVGSRFTSIRLEQRAGIVLLAADGVQNKEIAAMLGVGRVRVGRWRERYAVHRLYSAIAITNGSPSCVKLIGKPQFC